MAIEWKDAAAAESYTHFNASTDRGRFACGTDMDGKAWHISPFGMKDHASEDEARQAAENDYADLAPPEEVRRLRSALATAEVERDRRRQNMSDTWGAMVAMRNDINQYLPMPSIEADLLEGPEASVFCSAVAEAVGATVARLRAERDAAVAGGLYVRRRLAETEAERDAAVERARMQIDHEIRMRSVAVKQATAELRADLAAVVERAERAEEAVKREIAEDIRKLMDVKAAVERAARVLDDRARNERNRSEQHKATGKHYKAREAAHVARIAEQDAAAIRALRAGEQDGGKRDER